MHSKRCVIGTITFCSWKRSNPTKNKKVTAIQMKRPTEFRCTRTRTPCIYKSIDADQNLRTKVCLLGTLFGKI